MKILISLSRVSHVFFGTINSGWKIGSSVTQSFAFCVLRSANWKFIFFDFCSFISAFWRRHKTRLLWLCNCRHETNTREQETEDDKSFSADTRNEWEENEVALMIWILLIRVKNFFFSTMAMTESERNAKERKNGRTSSSLAFVVITENSSTFRIERAAKMTVSVVQFAHNFNLIFATFDVIDIDRLVRVIASDVALADGTVQRVSPVSTP